MIKYIIYFILGMIALYVIADAADMSANAVLTTIILLIAAVYGTGKLSED